jgi:hypothetical protein
VSLAFFGAGHATTVSTLRMRPPVFDHLARRRSRRPQEPGGASGSQR